MTAAEQRAMWFFRCGPATALEFAAHFHMHQITAQGTVWRLRKQGKLTIRERRHRGKGNGSGNGCYVYALVEQQASA